MDILYKILVLILISVAGLLILPFMPHLLIILNVIDTQNIAPNYLEDSFTKTSFVWMGSVLIGMISLFIQQKWRIILLLCPLAIPAIFFIAYTIMQQ